MSPETVAFASVLSSAAIAGGGLTLTFLNNSKQRDHEARLSYEQRAWEQKSGSLFGLIRLASSLVDMLDRASGGDSGAREKLATEIPDAHRNLLVLRPEIVAFASDECQFALKNLLEALRGAEPLYDIGFAVRLDATRKEKEDAIDDGDFDVAARQRAKERGLLREAMELASVDLVELQTLADLVVDTARVSVRGE